MLPLRRLGAFAALIVAIAATGPFSTRAADAPTGELGTYASLGSAFVQNMRLRELGWTDEQFAAFVTGFRAAYAGTPYPATEDTRRLFEETQRRLASAPPPAPAPVAPRPAAPAAYFDRLEHYLTAARENFTLQKSSSGLLFRAQGGAGPRPRPQDTIIVSIAAKAPDASTPLPQLSGREVRTKVASLLPGLAEGVQMIALGGEGFFILPPDLSFGGGKWPEGLEPGMPLIYELKLIDIIAGP